MKTVLGGVLLVIVLSSASLADIVADGNLADWGVTPGSNWNNNVGAAEWLETWVQSQGYVGPGYGGQPFNVEAMYAKADHDYLYYAIVTGFPDTGASSGGTTYYPGDVFFDLNPLYVPSGSTTPTGKMELAVETTSYDSSHPHGGEASLNEGAGSLYSDVTLGLATVKWDEVYYPVDIKRDSSKAALATLLGQTQFAYNDDYYGSSHYVIEGVIPWSHFGDLAGLSGKMWWTMTCANDVGTVCFDVPTSEIPEPGTLLLMGSGFLFGVGYLIRRRMGS